MVITKDAMQPINSVPGVAGAIVGIVEHDGLLYLACQYRVYVMKRGEFEPVKFKVEG